VEPLLGLLSSNNLPNLAKILRFGKSNRWSGKWFFQKHGLHQAIFIDKEECGGAGCSIQFWVGSEIAPIPLPELVLPVCLQHFLDGGTDTEGMTTNQIPRSMVKMDSPKCAVSSIIVGWCHFWPKELFPTQNHRAKVFVRRITFHVSGLLGL